MGGVFPSQTPAGSSVAVTPLSDGGEESAPLIPNLYPSVAKLFAVNEVGEGTFGARWETDKLIWEYLQKHPTEFLVSEPGTDILYTICTGQRVAPKRTWLEINGELIYLPKCPVDSSEAPSTLRDPHNWFLNLLIHTGIFGAIIFIMGIVAPVYSCRKVRNSALPISLILLYLVCGAFSVIISAPFALLPISVSLAWLIASKRPQCVSSQIRGE